MADHQAAHAITMAITTPITTDPASTKLSLVVIVSLSPIYTLTSQRRIFM
jgi:hypothetical protein